MKDEDERSQEMRMHRWKMREELLNAMGEKELRAFIKGYMMAERKILKAFRQQECSCQGSGCGDSCRGESCNCGDKDCKGC